MASETGQAQHPHPPARQEASPPSPSSAAHNGGDHGSAAAGLLPVGNGNGTAAKLKDTTEPQQQQPLLPRAPEPEPERAPLFPDDDDDEDADGDGNDSPSVPSEPASEEGRVSSPPYWMHSRPAAQQQQRGVLATTTRHARAASGASSAESVLPPGAITLQDNERDDEGGVSCGDGNGNGNGNGNGWHGYRPWEAGAASAYGRDRNRACWARSVQVTDYVLVNGSATNIGAFVVWIIRVETLNGSYMNIRKRYSEFDELRRALVQTFPTFEAAVPALPPKSVLHRFRPRFLEKRRAGLQYFLNCILLNPEFSGSPVLKEFLFS